MIKKQASNNTMKVAILRHLVTYIASTQIQNVLLFGSISRLYLIVFILFFYLNKSIFSRFPRLVVLHPTIWLCEKTKLFFSVWLSKLLEFSLKLDIA